jgi:hypothetical protein
VRSLAHRYFDTDPAIVAATVDPLLVGAATRRPVA